MKIRILILIFFFPLQVHFLDGQESSYGPGYQTIMMANPAYAGIEGNGTLRLSYLNLYPGRNYNLHSVYASYDSFIPVIHGGAAAFISNSYMGGIVNDMRGGLSYSYHLQAQKNLFINAGLSASFFHRGFATGNMVFPDQIDPLGGVVYQTGEQLNIKGRTVFDVGAGLLVMAGNYTGSIAVNHLTSPDLSGSGMSEEKIGREIAVHFSGLIPLGSNKKFDLRPVVYGDFGSRGYIYGGGGIIETGILSINAMILSNSAGDLDLQTGLFFRRGSFSFFYNYCFNISSVNNLLPASLFHHAGIVLSLNNVDKRKPVKTINLPKC